MAKPMTELARVIAERKEAVWSGKAKNPVQVHKEQTGGREYYRVSIEANTFFADGGKVVPYATSIGTINAETGKINVWMPAAATPQGYKAAAKRALERVRQELRDEGSLRDPEKEKRTREEKRAGSFIVVLSSGERSRFHEMRAAMSWAEDKLRGRASGSYAAFYRAPVSREHSPTGYPYTEPLQVLLVNEYGHIHIAGPEEANIAPLPRAFSYEE